MNTILFLLIHNLLPQTTYLQPTAQNPQTFKPSNPQTFKPQLGRYESLSVTVRLNTGTPGAESLESATK